MEDFSTMDHPIEQQRNIVKISPENPHYLMYQGHPVLLITSAEHYGAVVNQDFEYRAYFETLAEYGLNYTRIYPGAYVEVDGMFIEENTLAPITGRHLLPWERSTEKGAWDGGNKYDLKLWSAAYFERLRDFISQAARYNIVVEICLYNCQYQESWHACALNPANNIQGIGPEHFNDFQTLKDPTLARAQGEYVRKIVREVNIFDNVILEICDEPTLKGTPADLAYAWIDQMIQVIVETEKDLPKKHLIAQQFMADVDFTADNRVGMITTQYIRQNESKQVGGVEALDSSYGLKKPIECNETAYYPIWYRGNVAAASRVEAWEFILGGGAAFNQLNGRFTVTDPRGATPDNLAVLRSLHNLKAFMEELPFWKMARDTDFIQSGVSQGTLVRGISQPGEQYAFYFHHSQVNVDGVCYAAKEGEFQQELEVALPPGKYTARWVLPEEGRVITATSFSHAGGSCTLKSPLYHFDLALSIQAVR
jgi:hypothetical protein